MSGTARAGTRTRGRRDRPGNAPDAGTGPGMRQTLGRARECAGRRDGHETAKAAGTRPQRTGRYHNPPVLTAGIHRVPPPYVGRLREKLPNLPVHHFQHVRALQVFL